MESVTCQGKALKFSTWGWEGVKKNKKAPQKENCISTHFGSGLTDPMDYCEGTQLLSGKKKDTDSVSFQATWTPLTLIGILLSIISSGESNKICGFRFMLELGWLVSFTTGVPNLWAVPQYWAMVYLHPGCMSCALIHVHAPAAPTSQAACMHMHASPLFTQPGWPLSPQKSWGPLFYKEWM